MEKTIEKTIICKKLKMKNRKQMKIILCNIKLILFYI